MYHLSFAQHQRSQRDTLACHYGMTADIRYVFTTSPHLFAVDLWKRLAIAPLTHLQLSSHSYRMLLSKSAAAMLCLFLCFSCSVGFCHSSLFVNWAHRRVRSHAGGFFYEPLLQKGSLALSGLPHRPRCWALRAVFKVFASTLSTAE